MFIFISLSNAVLLSALCNGPFRLEVLLVLKCITQELNSFTVGLWGGFLEAQEYLQVI